MPRVTRSWTLQPVKPNLEIVAVPMHSRQGHCWLLHQAQVCQNTTDINHLFSDQDVQYTTWFLPSNGRVATLISGLLDCKYCMSCSYFRTQVPSGSLRWGNSIGCTQQGTIANGRCVLCAKSMMGSAACTRCYCHQSKVWMCRVSTKGLHPLVIL